MSETPRKARTLGPVHLYPEPPKKLAAGSRVTAPDRGFGKVKTINPGDRYVVDWEDGSTSTETRTSLLSVFTSTSPKPRKKARA